MPELDHVLRAVLTFEAMLALLFAGHWVGSTWHERTWPIRVILIGIGLVMTYLLAGQFKAFNLGIPFDAFSWLGLIAYAVLLSGFTWQRHRERRTRRGR
ncbi:hypothetical protein NPS01_25630 [Nocardioides psychrotolerans]|uniref:Uncharacterized protein n=1 Tax=Nocardioides psychrotolerans TaxID=1005945 RepID=A0A1I3LSD6_9ACTN|nr:hypothetical protein [Nocardioides psychrotolerans]GEP38900.1 hypothetical protein NPS01_25630 [Nocardioides psychrotolerans]SFI87415.1 hypothetical protein SAMN05216561_11468 [Nocardioides psychrotolerans]